MQQTAPTPPPQPRHAVIAPEAQPGLDDLGEARGIAMNFLRRYDDIAQAMKPAELKEALADKGQMTLNVVRMDRALRQIVILEQETMGLREPAIPRGFGIGAGGGNGRGNGKVRLADLSDANDLNDLEDLEEFQELKELYDFDDAMDVASWGNLAALEKAESWEEYSRTHMRPEEYPKIDEVRAAAWEDAQVAREMAETGRPEAEIRAEHKAIIQELIPKWKAELKDRFEGGFYRRRAALLKLRDAERAWRQGGRGPPAG
jgi:hypothetical protein